MSETVRFLLRVPKGIWDDVIAWAKEDRRSINQQVVFILQRAVEDWRTRR